MEPAVAQILAEYNQRWNNEFGNVIPGLTPEEIDQRRDSLLMSVGPDTGSFLEILARSSGATSILELGTAFGHSTVYLAEAARANGGCVTSCDLDRTKQEFARKMLVRAGLDKYVRFIAGDVFSIIKTVSQQVDFCLVDLWTEECVAAFEALYPLLAVNGYVIADNMIIPETIEAADYRRAVQRKEDLESVLLPIGWGLEVSRRIAGPAVTSS